MSHIDPQNRSVSQRLEMIMRRERIRDALGIAGIALVVAGVLLAILPLGPPLSIPDVIPKADPHAGLGLAQPVAWKIARVSGIALAVLGGALLMVRMALGIRWSADTSPERAREK